MRKTTFHISPAPSHTTLQPDVLYVMVIPPTTKAAPIIKNSNVSTPIRRDPLIPTLSPKNNTTKASFGTNQPINNQSYAQITSSGQNYTQLSSSIETLLSSFISEFSNIIKPLLSLLTSLLIKSQQKPNTPNTLKE